MRFYKKPLSFVKSHKKTSIGISVVFLIILFLIRPKPAPSIDTTPVTRGDVVETLSLTGTINSQTVVPLTFQIGGQLVYVGAKKGDMVKQYQTIASLDSRTVQTNLQNALINYSEQRNTFDQTLQNNNAKTPTDAISNTIERILEDNQFDLNKSVNSVELQQIALQNSYLTSPINGIIVSEDVSVPGVNITPATTFTVADPNKLVVDMDVDEADAGSVRVGMPVQLTLDAYPDKTLNLKVASIDFQSHTNSTGSTVFTIEANLNQTSDLAYKIGMSGDAEVILDQKDNTLQIPSSALTSDGYVYVKQGKFFEKRKVVTGIQSDTDTQVISGVSENDQVITAPSGNIPLVGSSKSPFGFLRRK